MSAKTRRAPRTQRKKERKNEQEMSTSAAIPMTENEVAKVIVDAGFHIHQTVGPGLLESVYEMILARELAKRGLIVERQRAVPIRYEDMEFELKFRADLIVNDLVIVE